MARITNEQIEELLPKTRGNVAQVARTLGVTRGAVLARIAKSEKLQEMLGEARASMIDDAESSLYKQVLAGNIVATIFFLKTQGGYKETSQVEHSGPGGAALTFRVEYANQDD